MQVSRNAVLSMERSWSNENLLPVIIMISRVLNIFHFKLLWLSKLWCRRKTRMWISTPSGEETDKEVNWGQTAMISELIEVCELLSKICQVERFHNQCPLTPSLPTCYCLSCLSDLTLFMSWFNWWPPRFNYVWIGLFKISSELLWFSWEIWDGERRKRANLVSTQSLPLCSVLW